MGDKFGDNEDDELECVEFDEINPLKGRSDSWLHFATQVWLTFEISAECLNVTN